jgi:hypothetical protein
MAARFSGVEVIVEVGVGLPAADPQALRIKAAMVINKLIFRCILCIIFLFLIVAKVEHPSQAGWFAQF